MCGVRKPLIEFYPNLHMKDNRLNRCKVCIVLLNSGCWKPLSPEERKFREMRNRYCYTKGRSDHGQNKKGESKKEKRDA